MRKKICFDFDGVLAEYDGWKGFDVLGKPKQKVVEIVRQLKKEGHYIIIYTSRADTPTLRKWLEDNDVPYDNINREIDNPAYSSIKIHYHCLVDDRVVNPIGLSKREILKRIRKIIK